MEKQGILPNKYLALLTGFLVFLGLYVINYYNNLLFHSLAEIFSIIVACGIFMIIWNSRQFQDNNYFLFIGIAYLFIGVMEMVHALAYPGLNVFQDGINLPTQLWISSRCMEGISFLIAPLLINRKLKINYVFFGYTAVVSFLLIIIFRGNIFPDCFIEGIGLSRFNLMSEYGVCLVLSVSIFLLIQRRREFDKGVLRLLIAGLTATIFSELTFTMYPVHGYGFCSLTGHFLQILSFYLIYKAIIETGLRKPYHLLFRNLKQSEISLRKSERELTIRNRIADIFLTIPDDKMYGEVLQVVLEAMESKLGAFGYINQDGDIVFASFTKEIWDHCRMPDKKIVFPPTLWRGIWGQALIEKRTICSNKFHQAPEGHIPITRALVVPIIYQEEAIGEIMVANKAADYTQKDQDLLEIIVNSKVAPILYARLQKERQERERKRAEELIKIAYAELDQIFNTAADGMRLIDKDFNCLRLNKTFLTLSGLSEDEAVGKKCYEVFPGPTCHTPQCSMTRILGGEERVECDIEKKRPDGLKIPCLITVTPFRGPDGKLIGIVEDFKDITERKQMETELCEAKEEAEEKYLALVEQAKDGVVIIQEGILRFANKSMAEILGYTVEEMIGKQFFQDMVAPGCRDFVAERNRSRLSGEKVPSFYEAKLLAEDGGIKDAEISAGIIQYQGKPGTMAIIRDITARKRMEEELQKAQKLESIGILAGGIAHDFKNILVAIVGGLSLAKMHVRQEHKIFEILAKSEKAALRATDLTQQLLTFSRGGAPVKKTASIAELLRDTACFALRGSKVKCEFFIPDDLWAVEIDESQISQVVNNLVINANQAMPEGGVIKVYAENMVIGKEECLPLMEGKYIKLLVKDHGAGIPKKHIHKIFDPYFTTKSKGTGLGLSTTYSIIKRHEGYITVESKAGVGTTFFLYLPASLKGVCSQKDLADIPCTGQGKILFMDDEQDVRDIAGEMLNYIGYKVEFAVDGVEAIELYKKAKELQQPFDAVIMDLTIPGGMGGEEAIKKLRELDPEIKAIVSSGYSNAPIIAQFQEHGFSGVIPKPYEVKDLSEVLHKVIEV